MDEDQIRAVFQQKRLSLNRRSRLAALKTEISQAIYDQCLALEQCAELIRPLTRLKTQLEG